MNQNSKRFQILTQPCKDFSQINLSRGHGISPSMKGDESYLSQVTTSMCFMAYPVVTIFSTHGQSDVCMTSKHDIPYMRYNKYLKSKDHSHNHHQRLTIEIKFIQDLCVGQPMHHSSNEHSHIYLGICIPQLARPTTHHQGEDNNVFQSYNIWRCPGVVQSHLHIDQGI